MRSYPRKGILLEQNKEPGLSKEIRILPALPVERSELPGPVSSTPDLLAPYEIVSIAKEANVQSMRSTDGASGRSLRRLRGRASRESWSMRSTMNPISRASSPPHFNSPSSCIRDSALR